VTTPISSELAACCSQCMLSSSAARMLHWSVCNHAEALTCMHAESVDVHVRMHLHSMTWRRSQITLLAPYFAHCDPVSAIASKLRGASSLLGIESSLPVCSIACCSLIAHKELIACMLTACSLARCSLTAHWQPPHCAVQHCCRAQSGGAIYSSGVGTTWLNITSTLLSDNLASSNASGNGGDGDAVYIDGSGARLTNNTFQQNAATGRGGAVFYDNQCFQPPTWSGVFASLFLSVRGDLLRSTKAQSA